MVSMEVWTKVAGNLASCDAVKNQPTSRFVRRNISDDELVNELIEDGRLDILAHFAAKLLPVLGRGVGFAR